MIIVLTDDDYNLITELDDKDPRLATLFEVLQSLIPTTEEETVH